MFKARVLVSLLIIPLAGTLVRFVPPPRTRSLVTTGQKHVRELLIAQLIQSAKSFRAGDFHNAAFLSQQGANNATRAGEPRTAAYFYNNLGGCYFALHQYREALQSYLTACSLAVAVRDNVTACKLNFNISSLYAQLGQMDAAVEAIGRATARLSASERLVQLPGLLIHLAALQADQGHLPPALDLYRQGIAAADRAGDAEDYAYAWNDLGSVYLKNAQYPMAEHALLEAYRVRKLNHLRSVESSYQNLGMLRAGQGDARAALALLDRAVALSREPGGLRPNWDVYYARGTVRLQQNRMEESLDDLRIAARLARAWRRGAVPGDATRVSTENMIQKVHSALVEAGNRLYFATGRRELAQETFESAEANRAASLRALLAEPRDWRRSLPVEYWETLQKLESAEVELVQSSAASSAATGERIRSLQGALIQMESRAGSNTDAELPGLLERTRRGLRPDAAFLAFHLSARASYLWAVSREQFALYRLPPGPEIGRLVAEFSSLVRRGGQAAQPAGARIFRVLFGQLDASFRKKPRWLLALDAQLFELPFAALVEQQTPQGPVFLAERHALQITSGAAMLSAEGAPRRTWDGPFVGVADPVYNLADPRWKGSRPATSSSLFTARASEVPAGAQLNLARLAGSAREVAASADAWNGSRPRILLEGSSANRSRLQAALAAHPAVLHFATHVIDSGAGSGPGARSGLIVLSLNQAGRREVLSPVEMATWNLDGALVSLSGCSSGSADALPATGLMGLTRACQAAGASAVIASRWVTPDDAGALFPAFYRYLRAAPQAGPAVALQHAQIDMFRSRTWRSDPLYWGAYFVMGNQQ